MLNNGCQRDSKGRFVKRSVQLVQAPSYIAVAVGMDRVIAAETVATTVVVPVAHVAHVAAVGTSTRLPQGWVLSLACWLLVMLSACGYAATHF